MSEWVNETAPLPTIFNCRVGNTYAKKECEKGEPCYPVEGSFITECAMCNRFSK